MPPLDLPAADFRRLGTRVLDLATDFLASLAARRTVSPAAGADTTAAFELPLPRDGIGDAVLADLEAMAGTRGRRPGGACRT
jgi:hypothetical protein